MEAGGSGELIGQPAYKKSNFCFTERPCLMTIRQRAGENIQHPVLAFTYVCAHVQTHMCALHKPPLQTQEQRENCRLSLYSTINTQNPCLPLAFQSSRFHFAYDDYHLVTKNGIVPIKPMWHITEVSGQMLNINHNKIFNGCPKYSYLNTLNMWWITQGVQKSTKICSWPTRQ